MDTEIGKIATALDDAEEELTPLQKVLAKLSKSLGLLTLAVVVAVFIADLVWIFIDCRGGELEKPFYRPFRSPSRRFPKDCPPWLR